MVKDELVNTLAGQEIPKMLVLLQDGGTGVGVAVGVGVGLRQH